MARRPDFHALAAPGVQALQPYTPGKPMATLERELGIRESIKLASNENPLGPPPGAVAAVREALAGLALYPDGAAHALKARLAETLGITPDMITVGNGSNDVIVLAAEAFLVAGAEAVFDRHAFLVFPLAVQAAGAVPRIAESLPGEDPDQPFGHDPVALARQCTAATRLLYVANPNNPTGTWLDREALVGLLRAVSPQTVVILDEAYCEYVDEPGYPDGLELLREFPNLIVTRTFSKIYALAGLRVGYAVSRPEIADLLNRVRQPFNVNALAQVAATAALDDRGFVARSREANRAGRAQLTEGLAALGVRVNPSVGNFVLARFGTDAGACYEGLLRAGVIVRPVANYGLPGHLRISVGLPAQNARLLDTLAQLRAGSAG